jgi:alpha-L-fucosidase 2
LKIALSRQSDATVKAAGRILSLTCRPGDGAPEHTVAVECRKGHVRIEDDALRVDDAGEVVLIVNPGSPTPVSAWRAAHIAAHQKLFRRVTLHLSGQDRSSMPTDERLEAVRKGADDPQLAALYFQYGRYLLIASSRSRYPANLQGLWNDKLDPPWQCDYHSNINLQMNYWPAELCNLAELHESLFNFVDGLRESARETARRTYGCRGVVLHHTTNLWKHTAPMGNPGYATWQDGFGWLARHYWEHYEFSADGEFLRQRAWPVMKEAAEFYLDFLVEHPRHKWLVPGPTSSPENSYVTPDGKRATISMGPAISLQVIRDLFTNCMAAARVLQTESDFAKQLEATLARLAPLQTGRDGQIREWPEDFAEREPGHRHLSPVYALYPASRITPRATPELAVAARNLIDRRLAHGSGQTGWSCAWIINLAARLKDAELAHRHVVRLLRQSTSANLFDTHPYQGGDVFQIDGNFGGCAGIAEMLLASHEGEIELLPALPSAWPAGRVTGLRARGAVTVDMEWRDGQIQNATFRAAKSGSYAIRIPGESEPQKLSLKQGVPYRRVFR